jgi:RNA recognition motif-containing protein
MSGPSRYNKSSRSSHPYSRGPDEDRGSKKTPAIGKITSLFSFIGKDEANELERPCRRLFVRNCNFDVREDEIKELFTAYGEIKNFCDLISRRGICFLTFYDLRGAERARTALNGSNMRGRSVYMSLLKID